MNDLQLWQLAIVFSIIVYFAVCFGLIARRNGRNPFIWGVLSVLTPINAIILGYWAVTGRLPFGGKAQGAKQ